MPVIRSSGAKGQNDLASIFSGGTIPSRGQLAACTAESKPIASATASSSNRFVGLKSILALRQREEAA